jgi:L-seryl-tRNA(Ser) seleniumtransferase
MLTADPTVLRKRARRLKRRIAGAALADGTSAVGGGAFPDAVLPSTLVTIPASSCDAVLDALRRHDPPVIARASEGRVVLDPRTIAEDEVGIVAEAVGAALVDVQGPTSETG